MSDMKQLMDEIEALLEQHRTKIAENTPLTKEHVDTIMNQLRQGMFIIPVKMQDDDRLAELKAEVERTGRPVKLPEDARPTPILIQNPNKENYVAIYTSMKQIPDTIKHDGCVQMKFDGCMNYAKQAGNTVHGVVVNPFTHNFIMKVRKEQKVTPEQFHMLARKNVEFVLFPHSIYSNGKDYFDGINEETLYRLFRDQYANKLPVPYTQDDFAVMQLGISADMDLIHIDMPSKQRVAGGCIRIYATWTHEKNQAGYYMIVQGEKPGERRFLYMNDQGKVTDYGEAPVESVEMQTVLEKEKEMQKWRN